MPWLLNGVESPLLPGRRSGRSTIHRLLLRRIRQAPRPSAKSKAFRQDFQGTLPDWGVPQTLRRWGNDAERAVKVKRAAALRRQGLTFVVVAVRMGIRGGCQTGLPRLGVAADPDQPDFRQRRCRLAMRDIDGANLSQRVDAHLLRDQLFTATIAHGMAPTYR